MPVIRLSAASRSGSASLPRCTAFSMDRVMLVMTLATFSSLRARNITSKPALANTSMIPVAIVPEPATPTRSTGRAAASTAAAAGVCASSTTCGESGWS